MEERVASSADDHPQLQSSRPEPHPTIIINNANDYTLTLELSRPPPAGYPLETYVVQVPKDQIYRIPPPENALLVESYLKTGKADEFRKRSFCKHLLNIVIALAMMAAIVGISLTVLYHSFTPEPPVFSVSELHVQKHSGHNPAKFDAILKVKNPNGYMGIKYGSVDADVSAKLIYSSKKIGMGQFPKLFQDGGGSDVVHVKLQAPGDQPLPADIQKSMNSENLKQKEIPLVLRFMSPLSLNLWIFRLWSRTMYVACDFRVNTVGKGTKILSQQCDTKLS